MRTIKLIIFLSVLAAMVGTASAAVIYQENFEGLTANATLHGQNGWTYDPAYGNDPLSNRSSSPDEAWVIDTSSTGRLTYTSADSSIVLSGGDRKLAVIKHYDDPLDPSDHVTKFSHVVAYNDAFDYPTTTGQLDTVIYFSVLMQAGPGISGGDSSQVQLRNVSTGGGNASATTLGDISWNDGTQWLSGKGGAVNGSNSWATPWTDNSTKDTNVYMLVGKLEKEWQWHDDPLLDDIADRAYFTRLQIWINPNAGDSATPDGISKYHDSKVHARPTDYVDEILFYVENGTDPSDVFYYDNLVIGETWGDVIPEPATMVLLGLGGLALLRRKK